MYNVRLFTIGHSNRTIDELLGLLCQHGIEVLVDVRSHPYSRHNTQFNQEELREELQQENLSYHWAGRYLGGLRSHADESVHVALAEGQRAFADYMLTDAFVQGIAQLLDLAMRNTCIIMCAEKNPAQCHRGLIADYLSLKGVEVLHLIDQGNIKPHQLHPNARVESASLIYDRDHSGTVVKV